MGSRFLWDVTKKVFTGGLIGLTISDRYGSFEAVRGLSMHPTLNPSPNTFLGLLTDDRVLVTKFCLEKYKFAHGDIVVFRSPSNYKEKEVKRIIGLPGDLINMPNAYDTLMIPEGHCWVEGDNSSSSLDSRSFGPRTCTMPSYVKKSFKSCTSMVIS
ncbi:hypothetical protein IFM89_035429 [Coptis chinensis]|uniref:Mitochondrial inner membrane protease subunit 2 n=1 Tax=Coptis chinensis TaxID=261450 RepID=A0A835HEP8_9MAGN|nr:hypothetical protein IFM89_035429 [Coptis chinensis]